MPEKIGKYQVLERIGRGGMGTIFKAHDPILDRPVALKVISTEVEVTDELRTRFLREAQACARLRHPHIVTVYDMGEDDGRLYIVMELLEGDELRHLIAQRRTPSLEDKLSIMVQVCDGLHYAHQQGIVHRDIKPANIFLQRNGQVKILDFGIAQMANTDGGLTRTGLIMGTLPYMSPEQVRQRADHRSDIYSAGAVFYELLSMRRPFTSDDPMQLLEQLRTEDPPPLDQLDPSIPSELAAITARALRKDPAERFSDFEQMRVALQGVQRDVLEEARVVGARVREQRAELLRLRAALSERIGVAWTDETIPTPDESYRLAAIQALERDFASRIEALRAMTSQADAWAAAFQRATELLEAGHSADAVEEFAAIVADMPEHARALNGLARARNHVEAERNRQLTGKLIQDARSALGAGEFTLCLEILKQAAEIPGGAGAVQEIASLRETAESAVEAREASRRAQQLAEAARTRMTQARDTAQAEVAIRHAPILWNEAEAACAEAESAFAQEAYVHAGKTFDAACAAYRRFGFVAREAQRREQEAVDHARAQAAEGRQRSQAEGAEQYARDLWDAAETKSSEAHAALTDKELGRAAELFDEALALYDRAQEAASEARQRERQHAEEARVRATHARERTRAGGAPRYTQEPWEAVEAKLAEAEQAFTRQAYAQADQLFAAATDTYRHLEEAAREARRRERDAALRAREQMAQVRQAIQTDNSPPYAPTVWEEAEARSIQAEAAFAREEYAEAREGFEAADSAYRRVEEVAREARHRERDAVEQAREKAKAGRERALSASAPQYARGPWDAAEAQLVAAQTAFSAELLTRAVDLFNDALTLYVSAEKTAAEAVQRERRSAEEAQERVREALRAAAAADSERQAPSVWNAAATKSAEGETALFNRQYRQAVTSFSEALALYQKAENESRETRQQQRGQAELAHRAMVERRQAALAADAAVHAASQWHDAETSAEFGEAALAREAYTEARAIFDQTAGLYRSAEELAREAARTIAIARTDAEKARDATVPARRAAAEAQASRYAADRWRAGEDAEAQARAALSRAEHVAARSLFAEARRQYAAAGHAASIALEAENRRADAMVSVARQLLASGDIDACLRRLNEVLAFRPDHAGAQRLLQEAGPQSAADLSHAERAREAAKLARLAAAAAQAEQYTPEQWRASENVEADAASALERRDYAAASALFADAERLYATAAQAAGVAQTTETRRIDEMVADAQRLLIESEIQRCLDRLTEVLAIRPGHAVAERLRLEARSRLRRAEVDSANGETVYSGRTSVSLDQIAPEEQTARSSVPTDATVFAPPPVRDPSNAESPPHAEAPPMIVGAPTRTDTPTVDPGDLSRGLGPDLPGNIAQRTRTPRRLTVRGRGMVLAFGAMAAVVLGVGIWKYLPPRPDVWPPPALQELAKKVDTAREEALRAGADYSAQFARARENESAADAAFGRRNAQTAKERYQEALANYELARTEAKVARDAAFTAASQAADARKKAETAEAPTRAVSLWNKAETEQRDAASALEGRTFDKAQAKFAAAAKLYQDAEESARGDVLRVERQKARAAQADCAAAREEAERAQARDLAPTTFAIGQQKEDDAAAALDSDPVTAQKGFTEAGRQYKQAAKEGIAQRVTLLRTRVEQARARMTNARHEAERAGANQRARTLFDWGLRKERDAGVAFGENKYALAEQLFAGAQADYEITALEARRPEDGMTPAQLSAEQARRRAVAYREKAVKAGADRLVELAFGFAHTAEVGADKLMSLKSFERATTRYGEAGDGYLDVTQRAGDRREADNARAVMMAAKERAGRKAPEYRAALAEENLGTAAYDRDDYKEAAERFRTAQGFYTRAATKTAAGSVPSRSGTR